VADQRITQLNQLAEANVAAIDVLPIVDISASETKKVTAKDLFEAGAALADGSSIDLAKLNQSSATKLGTTSLADAGVTYAKIQNVSATDRLLGRSSVGAGVVQEITCTAAGRALLDDADAAAQRTTLGLGTIATQSAAGVAITGGTITGGTITGITDLAVADGGTGASDAGTARTNLGLAIGTNVQAFDAGLQSIAGLTTTAGQTVYTTASDTYAATSLTSFGRSLIDDTDAATARTTLGLGSIATQSAGSVVITGGAISGISSLTSTTSSLGNATITGGTITGITDLSVTDGGTGASTASAARTNLGVAIGTDVQAYDAGLQSISALTTAANQTIYTTGTDAYAVTDLTVYARTLLDDLDAATARTTLGLGTLSTQDGTFSGSHSGTTSGTNTGDQTITLTGDVTGTGTGTFAATIADNAITETKIAAAAVTTTQLASAAVTGPKLAADSSTVVAGNAPVGSGDFEGQQWFNTGTKLTYVWDGTTWQQQAGVQSFTFTDSTPLAFSSSVSGDGVATITSTLDDQAANTVLAGPTSGSAATPTFRALTATDLPVALSATPGVVSPGSGLSVAAGGVLNHSNAVTAGTYTKVTVDAQGHVSSGANLSAVDIPNLDASQITTGTFSSAFLATNSVTAAQLADYGIAQVSEVAPTPEFAGQWWINPSDRSAYIWVGAVSPVPNGYWLLVGYGAPTQLNLRFGGTYNANTNLVVSLNQYGVEAGLTVGQPLSTPNTLNNGVYLAVTTAGTGTAPAPAVTLSIGDWVLSQGTGSNWSKIAVVSGASGTFNDYDILCDGVYFTPDMVGVASVRDALTLLWGRTQIATTSQIGVVRESAEVLVDDTTGAMSIGIVDDGTY
jgi:hypothetical protein